jgi:hypothetical protein
MASSVLPSPVLARPVLAKPEQLTPWWNPLRIAFIQRILRELLRFDQKGTF